MSKSTSSSKKQSKTKTKIELNGLQYSWDDVSHLTELQKAHRRGDINVYEPIEQEEGEPLPPLAEQWKEDWKNRYGKSSSSR